MDFDEMVERAAQARLAKVQAVHRKAGSTPDEVEALSRWLPMSQRDVAETLADAGVRNLLEDYERLRNRALSAEQEAAAMAAAHEREVASLRRALLTIAQMSDETYARSVANDALGTETTNVD